ncbi:MAG: DUF72 domain-containing protein [Bdellovibrionales bacterium]|nr:DUF72 domain-containing protein [Bdellovibrionales bacterium]
MDFGALPRTRGFDRTLAPIHPGTRTLLGRGDFLSAETLTIRLGAPQWTIPGFSRTLVDYARSFEAIELNTAFYRVPTFDAARVWAEETPVDFRFFVKMHQELSHEFTVWGNRALMAERMRAFVEGWRGLGEKWGGSFLQLPPALGRDRLGLLEGWLALYRELDTARPLFVEFRAEDWFESRQLRREAARMLVAAGAGTVCTDTPGRRDACHGTLTSPSLFVRFLGQSLETDAEPLGVDRERLEGWIDRIEELRASGLREVDFFLHTTDQVWVPELARIFIERLADRGFRPRPWVGRFEPPAPQLSLF